MDFKTWIRWTHVLLLSFHKVFSKDNTAKLTGLLLVVLFYIATPAYAGARYSGDRHGDEYLHSKQSTDARESGNGEKFPLSYHSKNERPGNVLPLKPYPHLLPIQLIAPHKAQAGIPLSRISISLRNPGDTAPDASLRLIIHDKEHKHNGARHGLNPANVKVEVLEGGSWKPVMLAMVDENVLGVIGIEGVTLYSEHHRRGGFAIPAGFNKTWQLRITFSNPGIYTLVAAVSPDNGSRHLAQPAHSIIEVQ